MNNFLQIGQIINNEYKVLELISEGGMNSQIFKVCLISNEKEIRALKVIKKTPDMSIEFWSKFCDESVTSLRVSGKNNLIQTLEIFHTEDNIIYILMEYCSGYSLRNLINDKGYLQYDLALNIFYQIIIGVKELHDFNHQIIHRDLKPENILITKDLLSIKIIDFGISSVVDKINDSISIYQKKFLTQEKNLYGTYAYMCPDVYKTISEKKNKEDILSTQFDFYSLGIILYELLMGQRPFITDDDTKSEIIMLPLKYDMPNISAINPSIPIGIENIIFKCIASKKQDIKFRYTSIDQIIADVKRNKNDFRSDDALLKPIHQRIYQEQLAFNITTQIEKRKIFQQWYFFWIIIIVFIVSIIVFISLIFGFVL